MNVLSLFDGMSCGQIAFERANIKVNKYYASEIDQKAINVTMYNYPNTIQLGDVVKLRRYLEKPLLYERMLNSSFVKEENKQLIYHCIDILLDGIDVLIGGSPCQSFSLAGSKKGMVTSENIEVTTLDSYIKLKKEGYSFKGQSYLFWEYVGLLKIIKPRYFLLENVLMSTKWKDIITNTLDVEPVEIDSSLVSIQSRKRLYWSNIIFDKDVFDKNIYFYNEYSKSFDSDLILKGKGLNKVSRKRSRVYSINSKKLPTLLKEQESKATDSIVIKHGDVYRYPTREESEKMQTVPIGYTKVAKYNDAMGMLGNGWTVDVIAYIFSFIKQ